MEQFIVVKTISDHDQADHVCGALEDAGIPVLLEHVEIVHSSERVSGVRLLVPEEFAQRASHLVDIQLRGGQIQQVA